MHIDEIIEKADDKWYYIIITIFLRKEVSNDSVRL